MVLYATVEGTENSTTEVPKYLLQIFLVKRHFHLGDLPLTI